MAGALQAFVTLLVVQLSCGDPQWSPHWEHRPEPCAPEPHPPPPHHPSPPEPCLAPRPLPPHLPWPERHWPEGHWPEGHWPEGHYPKGPWPAGHWPDGHWPEGHWPEGHWPEGYWPEGYWPEGHFPEGYWPKGPWPAGHWPDGYWPEGHWPEGHWPEGYVPEGYYPPGPWPAGYWPEGHWPEGHWPEGHWPEGHWPEGHWPEGYQPVPPFPYRPSVPEIPYASSPYGPYPLQPAHSIGPYYPIPGPSPYYPSPEYWAPCDTEPFWGPYAPRHYDVPAVPPSPESEYVFPNDFSFGVTSGAYHIEGAWNQDGKGESIWDRWLHTGGTGAILDRSTGDYSADAYNHIKEDIEIFNNLTITHYRFSISWSRIIPNGCGAVNKAGIEHYKRLIHLLKINQIEPLVTIYQGDLPQALQDQGGILCPQFIDWYVEYARVLFENFGDDVKYWFTFNDPIRVCVDGFAEGTYAPGFTEVYRENTYRCGHNLLLAHAAAYHLYDDHFRACQKGKISFAIETDWFEPASPCESDYEASEIKQQFTLGWFMHPIYIGDYPKVMKERIAWKSQLEGRCESRLPAFTHSEIEYIKNTHDFFSISYVSFSFCSPYTDEVYYSDTCYDDSGVKVVRRPGNDAPGLRKLIKWINTHYHYPSIFVVCNGYSTESRCLSDWDRIEYLKDVLQQIRWAQLYDYARVYGFSYYSYIDGFEWQAGHAIKFGLYDVDFECPRKTRTPRESAIYYQTVCRTHRIVW